MTEQRSGDAWRIHFFRRHPDDDAESTTPAIDFLDSVPVKVAAEIHAVLDAVAEAPPPAFSGGGKWEAMHGDMAGLFEIRVQGGGKNHRLFCILDRGEDLGGPSIVCIDGLSKPPRQAASDRDYRRVRQFADEFRKRRTVLE
ncbi:MAG: type II toxin-antitoxin system RelE/ParE family toxin [Actinomycetota bacterium]|nr:type II toxin-antitoxin system RelE/ParE family toxin [Actinomycetota bacterium]